jgi:hypothetical protein
MALSKRRGGVVVSFQKIRPASILAERSVSLGRRAVFTFVTLVSILAG